MTIDYRLAFARFVERLFALRGNVLIKYFHLQLIECFGGAIANRWIFFALACNVSELQLQIQDLPTWSVPPPLLFVARSLLKLSIRTDFCILECDFHLPNLKFL